MFGGECERDAAAVEVGIGVRYVRDINRMNMFNEVLV